MSTTNWTQGPWFTKREGWATVYVEARIGGGLLQEVAACGPTQQGSEQQEANATLIAKAPELYKALEEALSCLADVAQGKGGWAWEEVLDSGEEALKKARGE